MVITTDPYVGIDEAKADRAARVLAGAFAEDPLMRFALPEHRRRRTALNWLFRRSIEYGQRFGEVLATPNAEAVAIWFGPVGTTFTIGRELRAGMLAAPFKLGLKAMLRLRAYDSLRDQLHAQCVNEPHLYLFAVGVHPAARHQGLAEQVLTPMLDRADRQRLKCYLETTNDRNLNYFGRFGFVPAVHERMSYGGGHRLNIWGLIRQPATPRRRESDRLVDTRMS